MSLVRDRVRAPLLLLLCGALLLVMGCTAMPKELLLIANGSSGGGGSLAVRCESNILPVVNLSGGADQSSGQPVITGSQGVKQEVTDLNVVQGVLSRVDRSVSSINSGGGSATQNRSQRHRHRASGGGDNSVISVRPRAAAAANRTKGGSNLERNERSANLSHINAKIQLFIKNRLLQILPDGTVNGTQDDSSDYSE